MAGFRALLGGFFSGGGARKQELPPGPAAGPVAPASHRYPPVDTGIPATAVADLMASQAELLKRLRYAYGAGEDAFERDIVSLVRRYAEYVHLLPATADSYFRGPGGLFRMGLEIAFFALQATDAQIFTGRQTITQRTALEPRWRYATFIAGLCGELHRTLSHVIVTNHEGCEWPAYLRPLAAWLIETKSNRYFLRWIEGAQETRALGVFALSQIVSPQIMQHLAHENAVVVPHLMAAISGTVLYRDTNVIDHLVRRSTTLVIDRDLRSNADLYGTPQIGSHLERYLVDAMRRLVAKGEWVPNGEKSRLWYAPDGMFLLWPNAAVDMLKLLAQDQLPGIPKSADTIAEILAAAGAVEARPDGALLWDVYPPGAGGALPALKLLSPLLLLSALDAPPAALSQGLLKTPVRASSLPSTYGDPAPGSSQLPLPMGPAASGANDPPSSNDAPEECPGEANEARPAPPSAPAPRPPITLKPSARLNPSVRDALQQIVSTIDSDPGQACAFVIDTGIFVPLDEFERRGVDTAVAVRSLAHAKMLAANLANPRSRTLSRKFGDELRLGAVLSPECLTGLDPHRFPGTAGGKDLS